MGPNCPCPPRKFDLCTVGVERQPRKLNPHQADVSESLIRRGRGGANMPHKENWLYWLYFCILCNKNGIKGLFILAKFLHSMQEKWDQRTLGRQRLTLIGFRTRLGPSMDPAMALQYTQHGPLYIGYIFAFHATKMG